MTNVRFVFKTKQKFVAVIVTKGGNMNILRFYKYKKGYWSPILTEDDEYFISKELYGKHKCQWRVFELDRLTYQQTGERSWSTLMSPHFQSRLDAMIWVKERFYPDWELQKKIIKKEN